MPLSTKARPAKPKEKKVPKQKKPGKFRVAAKKLAKLQSQVQNELEDKVANMDPKFLKVLDAYQRAKTQERPDKDFFLQLKRAVDENLISTVASKEIVAHVHRTIPTLSEVQKARLAQMNVCILTYPRMLQNFVHLVSCETFLSLYSFTSGDDGPYFDIAKLHRQISQHFKNAGQTWDINKTNYLPIPNPVHIPGQPNNPAALDFVAVTRIHVWYKAYKLLCNFRDSETNQKAAKELEAYDIF